MKEQLRKKCWHITKKCLGNEPMHGLPHINRVHSNFKIFESDGPKISDAVKDALEISVILHDIGRSVGGQTDHAAKSAEILEHLFQNELSEVENQEWIIRAVAKHSVGLVHELQDEGDIVLALLPVFDHLDCLGPIGVHRLTIYWCGGEPYRIPWIPRAEERSRTKEEIKYYLNHPEEIDQRHVKMREESFVQCLTYYFCATTHIIRPVKHLFGRNIMSEIQTRSAIMERYILDLTEALL